MVAQIVLEDLARRGFPNAVESSDFENDVIATPAARALWAAPLSAEVRRRGCDPTGFTSSDTRNAMIVRDIVDALWAFIRSHSRGAKAAAKAPARKRPAAKSAAKRGGVIAATVAVAATAGVATGVALRRRGITASTSACTLTNRGMVAEVVFDFLVARGFPNAVESSDFTDDVMAGSAARATWASQLATRVRQRGCEPTGFLSNDTRDAENVGEIIDALWEAIRA